MVFFYFHYGFRSSRPIADLRAVVFNRIARALTGPRLIEQQQLIYPSYLTDCCSFSRTEVLWNFRSDDDHDEDELFFWYG